MNKTLQGMLGMALVAGVATAAEAGTIDFNGGTVGDSVGTFYAGQGVTFTDATFDDGLNLSPNLQIRHTSSEYQPKVGNPIEATFSTAVANVSIFAMDVGENGARIDAYDVFDNLVAFDQAFGTGVGVGTNFTIAASSASIVRIEFYQPSSVSLSDGLNWDNLTFSTAVVPLPPAAFLGLGLLGGLGLIGRLRKRRVA